MTLATSHGWAARPNASLPASSASTDGQVHALRASDGRQLWSFAAAGPVASQIVVADGVAYLGSNDGKVYGLKGQPA